MAGPDFSSFGTLVDEAKTPDVPDFAKVDAGDKTSLPDFAKFGTPVDEPKASGHALDQPGGFSLRGDHDTSSIAKDFFHSLDTGTDTAAADLMELVRRAPVVGEKLKAADDQFSKWFWGQTNEEALKNASKNFSPQYQESREKKWWDDKEHWFGPAWSDPRSYAAGFGESLPEEAITMLPAMRLAKGAFTFALAKTGSEKLAANAAARTAMLVGGSSEGLLAGAQSSRQVRDDIKALPEETLRQSDAVKSLMAEGKSYQDAVDQVANDGATRAFFLAGVSTGIFSGMGDRVLAKLIMGTEGGLAKRIIKGAVTEGVLEEFPQSYLQQVSQNYAMQEANPKQDLFDDALNQGLAGLAIGAMQGGAMTGALGRTAKSAPSTPLSSEDVLGKEGTPPPPSGGGAAPLLALPAPKRDIIVDAQGNAREATSPESEQADLQRGAAEEQQRVSREDLGNTSPNAPRTDIEELRAQAVRNQDFAKLDELNTKDRAAQEEAAHIQRAQSEQARTTREQTGLDRLAEQQRQERDNAGPHQPTAMQLALLKAGVAGREFPTTPKDEAARQLEASQGRVLRTNPAEVSDGTLQFVAQSGQGQAKVVAQSELDRRDAVRAAGPSEQDRPVAEKLFNGGKLTQDERHRMVELGLGHQRGDGRWVISQRGRDYRTELRQKRGQAVAQKLGQPSMRRENDQALVERLNARSGEKYQLATPENLPADAKIGARIAESFGKRVLYVQGPRGTAGYVLHEDPNTIYINVNTKNPLITVIGHELLHTLRRTNEAVYKQLLDRLIPLMHNVQEYRDWLKTALAQEGQTLSDKEFANLAHEELLADFMGDHMMQSKFWIEVFRGQQRSWIEKVRDAIHIALDAIRIRMAVGGKRGWGTEKYIKDTDAVRRAMAEAYNAWKRQQTEKVVRPQATAQPAFAAREQKVPQPGFWEGPNGEFIETEEAPGLAERAKELALNDRRWYPAKAKETLKARASRTEPPVKEAVRPKGVTVTAETKPSTKLDKVLGNVDTLKLAKYQKDALAAVFGDKGLSALRDAMGFERTKFSYVEGTGAYEASISPNVVLTIDGSINDARRLARAWMYVFKQDAVPFFRADEKLLSDPKAPVGFQFNLAKAPTAEQERALYDTLRKKVHDGIGYTKTGPSEFVVINFRGDDGKPFLSLTDQQLLDRMEALVKGARLQVAVESFGAFGVKGEYPYHDWQTETSGRSLRNSASSGSPALQAGLDRWADSFQRFAEKRGSTLRSSEGRSTEPGAGAARALPGPVAQTEPVSKAPPSEGLSASTDKLAHEAATSPKNALPSPTAAQAEAGNYQKGHVRIAGLDVSIENPEGSQRRPEWPPLKSHYGYIRGTVGKDKDHLDIFVKPGTPQDYAGPVFVIDQKKQTGHFDEHKVMLGWATMPEARAGYSENYSKTWDGVRAIVRFENPEAFKAWLEHGDTKAPVETQAPLMERERDQTQTAAFKKWFGDSKVVDAEGKPLVVYHGTHSVTETFKRLNGMSGHFGTLGAANQKIGHDLDDGKIERPGVERVLPVFLSIQNPVRMSDVHFDEYGTMAEDLVQRHVLKKSELPIAWDDRFSDFGSNEATDGIVNLIAVLERKGYDGIVYENRIEDPGSVSYIPFRPEQIKSAIGNRGTFDPKDANILRSREARPVEDVVDELRTMWRDTSERPGKKFEFGLELERRPNGDWVSPDGRFEIVRDPNGYYAKVDDIEIGWGRDFQRARAHLLAKFKEEVKAGNIINPMEAKSVFARYAPEQQAVVVTAWKKIASLPNAFRFARSEATDLKTITKDMGIDRVIAKIDGFDMNEPEGKTGWINIDFIDGTTAVLHYSEGDKTAYLNASEMNKGGYGAQLYQSVLTWAANNKYVLVPDPGGLSLTNAYRRTEQMISAALRLDTTRYMRPHADQGLYGWISEPKTKAEEDHNFALMLLTSYENVYKSQADTKARTKLLAELSKITYNFDQGRFEHDGKPVTNREWGHLAHQDQSSFVGSGVTTLQRAVLTQSILEAARDRSGKGVAALVSSVPARGIADEDHPLRGILYARERDTGGGKVPRPGSAAPGGVVRRAALATARGAVAAARPVTAALDLANRAAETALKLPAKLLVAPVTSRLYDRVVGIGRAMAQKNAFAQEVAHGLIADYGLPEPYLDARQDRESRINAVLRQSKDTIDKIASLDRAEARVAYLWMQEAPNSAHEQQLLAQLPESSKQSLAQMKEQIDQLGQEAVKLGLLSPESFERNRMAYLHRTYKKYELENPQAVARSGRAKAIKADAYRGRGLRDDVAASRVPGAQAGDHYTRLEQREPATEGLGALKRVVYLKAGIPIPSTYAGWRQDGTWEARWFDPKKQDRVGMWRDLSPEERQRLGEIDEVRYAFARTMLATTRDIETARFLKHVATNYAKPNEDAVIEAGGKISEAVDSMVTLTTYADNEWVQVPTGYAAGTKIRKYGALAGQYIPGHIWNDIRSTINVKSGAAVWRLYDQLLRGWKISKTALSPVVHTNNVMSNFVLADMANVHFEDTRRALRTIIDAQRGNEAARTMMERYYDSGAEGGSQSAIELRKEIIEPFLAELEREQDQTLAHVGLIQALSLAIHGNLRQSLAAFSGMKSTQLAAIPFKVMIDAYRSEDAVFRLAKFIKETEAGKSDREAGKEARAAFLDYNINAPWIQALRRGPLPFVSFSYRAIPLLIQTAAKQPWKMMKYFAVGYGLNALAYAMLGSAGDEDKERKLMPDEKSGRALGVFYRMLRMPWNDENGSPVFFDVRRWIPGGDIVDLTGSQSAIPLPSWMSIGGPLSLMIELVANKDLQTGRPIVKETDTTGEAVTKLSDHLFKFASPNLPVPNPLGYAADFLANERGLYQTYSWKSIQAAGTGETDAFGRERSLPQALSSAAGFKLSTTPEDVAKQNLIKKRDSQVREIGETMSGYRRQHQVGGLNDEEYAQRREAQQAKKQDVTKKFNERIGLEYR